MVNKFYRIKKSFGDLVSKIYKKIQGNLSVKKINRRIKLFIQNGLSRRQTLIIALFLILCIFIVLSPRSKTETPIGTIHQIGTAIENSDSFVISQLVDVDRISNQIASTILSQSDDQPLTQDILQILQNDLEEKILLDFFNIVENSGKFHSLAKNKEAILSRLLETAFGSSGKIIDLRVEQENNKDDAAIVKFVIYRPDMESEIDVHLKLKKYHNVWIVKEIKNPESVFTKLNKIEEERSLMLRQSKNFGRLIVLKDFKASDLDPENNTIVIRVSLKNISEETITSISGSLNFFYRNQLIGTSHIDISDIIMPYSFYEKSWLVSLKNKDVIKQIQNSNLSDITAIFEIENATFSEGAEKSIMNVLE